MLKASESTYKEFVKSSIWDDIKAVLTTRLELIRDDLEYNADNIDELRGRAKELRFLLNLPQYIIDNYTRLSEIEKEGF